MKIPIRRRRRRRKSPALAPDIQVGKPRARTLRHPEECSKVNISGGWGWGKDILGSALQTTTFLSPRPERSGGALQTTTFLGPDFRKIKITKDGSSQLAAACDVMLCHVILYYITLQYITLYNINIILILY